MKTINVLGNNSGRNAGDAAILGGLLADITDLYDNVSFTVPTINSQFVRNAFAEYPVTPIPLMPWNMSLKILGVPTWTSVMRSDLVLVTDAILFDRKLYNPLFNYLWTLSMVLPRAKSKGIPVVLYNTSLGPIRTDAGRNALKRILDSADLLVLRDRESQELLQDQNLKHDHIVEGADCALNAVPANDNVFEQMCAEEGLFQTGRPVIGFNINNYVDAFVREDGSTFGRENLIELYAQTVDRVIRDLDVEVVFVETQHMDMGIANSVLAKIQNMDRVRMVSNKKYSYGEICAVLKRMATFVGMRTHSLILSSTMGVPPVGIITYPKNRGYMRTIDMEDNLVAFRDLSLDSFYHKIRTVFENRDQVKEKLAPAIAREKDKAKNSAKHLNPFLTKE
jgi:polysaccharide pyruvyl transferase WcaK-like protein